MYFLPSALGCIASIKSLMMPAGAFYLFLQQAQAL